MEVPKLYVEDAQATYDGRATVVYGTRQHYMSEPSVSQGVEVYSQYFTVAATRSQAVSQVPAPNTPFHDRTTAAKRKLIKIEKAWHGACDTSLKRCSCGVTV